MGSNMGFTLPTHCRTAIVRKLVVEVREVLEMAVFCSKINQQVFLKALVSKILVKVIGV